VKATVGELPKRAIWESLAAKFQLDEPEMGQLQADFWSGDRLDMHLVDFLSSLRPRYKIAILSNAWTDARDEFNRQYHLDCLADLIVISSEERLAKPDPRIFHLLASRLGVDFGEIIFIDDFPENIQAAEKLGIRAVAFQSTPQAIDEVKKILSSPGNSMG
jgi:epoxide hydrolase-like predicted phosphatase